MAAACLGATLAGCGGGGGSTPPVSANAGGTTAGLVNQIALPPTGTVNTDTTYSVWVTTANGAPSVGIAPLGSSPPSGNATWLPVTTGAMVVYPDGSVQLTDALGNFDASQSPWAQTNAAALAANPNDNPEVWVALIETATQTPLDTTVVAYAPQGGPTMTASVMRSALGMRTAQSSSAPLNELTAVTVYPRGAAVFDNDTRTFTAVGTDSDGNYVSLAKASISWTMGGCNTSPSGAGTVTAFATNAAKATYVPPASGTFTTPDEITATVSANGTTYCAASAGFYYDPSQGVSIAGVLDTAAGKPVADGIVSFYNGGKEFYHGTLLAATDANGNFKRTVPPNRTLSLVGGQNAVAGGSVQSGTFYTLNPATVTVGGAGTTVAAATYAENVPFQNPFKPLPPLDRVIRDAYYVSNVTLGNFPFNRPKSGETSGSAFKTCSLDAIVNNQSDSTAGHCAGNVVATGEYYSGWTVTYLPASGTATQWIFQQPASQEGGRHVLQIASTATPPAIPNGISDGNTQGLENCTAPTSCWTYAEFYNPAGFTNPVTSPISETSPTSTLAGTILANDGAFNENNTIGGSFVAYLLRNEYTVGHQTPGSPLYTHTMTATYATPSAATGTFNDDWYNVAGLVEGSIAVTRTPDTGDAGYTYTATGSRQYYKGSTPNTPLTFSVTGSQAANHSGTMTIAVQTSPDPNETFAGAQLNVVASGGTCPASPGSASYPSTVTPNTAPHICGAVDTTAANATNLSGTLGSTNGNPNVALFTVDSANYVNVYVDPSIGSAAAFHL